MPVAERSTSVLPDAAVEEAFEVPAADGVLQLPDRLRLDLANPLAGHLEDPADLFERVGVAVAQAVAELDDLALAVRQRLEDAVDLVLEHLLRRRVDRRLDAVVLDEVAEVAVLALADGPIEADRVPADLHHPPRLLDRDAGFLRRLLDRRFPAKRLEQLLRDVAELRHRLDHVDRNADRAGLVRDRSR